MIERAKGGGYSLNYSKMKTGKVIGDDDLRYLDYNHSEDYEEVDFSGNSIGSRGCKEIATICKKACSKLRVLKLFKNQITDAGAQYIVEVLKAFPYLEEVHLSHNRLTSDGIEKIVSAASKGRPRDAQPLWLRLEQNDVSDPERFVQETLLDKLGLSVCVQGGGDQRECHQRVCAYRCKVHLPFFVGGWSKKISNKSFKGDWKGKGDKKGKGKGDGKSKGWEDRRNHHDDRFDNDRWGSPPRQERSGEKVVLTPAAPAKLELAPSARRRTRSTSFGDARNGPEPTPTSRVRSRSRDVPPSRREDRGGGRLAGKEKMMLEAARARRMEKERDMEPDRDRERTRHRRHPDDGAYQELPAKRRRVESQGLKENHGLIRRPTPQGEPYIVKQHARRKSDPPRTLERANEPEDRMDRSSRREQRPVRMAKPAPAPVVELNGEYSDYSEYTELPPPPGGAAPVNSASAPKTNSAPKAKAAPPPPSVAKRADPDPEAGMSDVESGCSSASNNRWAQDRGCSPPSPEAGDAVGVQEDDDLEEYSESEERPGGAGIASPDPDANGHEEKAASNAAGAPSAQLSRMQDLKKRLAQHWEDAKGFLNKSDKSSAAGAGEQNEEEEQPDSTSQTQPSTNEGRVLRRLKKN